MLEITTIDRATATDLKLNHALNEIKEICAELYKEYDQKELYPSGLPNALYIPKITIEGLIEDLPYLEHTRTKYLFLNLGIIQGALRAAGNIAALTRNKDAHEDIDVAYTSIMHIYLDTITNLY